MAKAKECSFCNKQVPKLWYSNPACCPSYTCMAAYKRLKSKKGTETPKKKKASYIKPFSDRQLRELAKYRPIRDEFLEKNKVCQIKAPGCTHAATQVHHAKPRRHYLCDVSIFVASCTNCNMYVENHDSWARERGFKLDHLGDKSNK